METVIDYSEYGFVRVAAATPDLRVADVDYNCRQIEEMVNESVEKHNCRLIAFPELAITAYSCGDLFFETHLQQAAIKGLERLAAITRDKTVAVVVGLPVAVDGRLFNCAALLADGDVKGIVPKTYLPNTDEFYEERWFSSAHDRLSAIVKINDNEVPFGEDIIFSFAGIDGLKLGIEICEDLWAVSPPSEGLALAGATLLVNPSASPESLAKSEYRRSLVVGQSARCLASYLYASAGPGESSTDLVYSGHAMIAENGQLLTESERFSFDSSLTIADIDVDRLQSERIRNNSFASCQPTEGYREVEVSLAKGVIGELQRPMSKTPFVPIDAALRSERCLEIFQLQNTALAKRLRHINAKSVVIGISGGLDSTLALLVTVKAFDRLGLDRTGIIAVTMPGPGTTERTKNNAITFAKQVGVTLREVPIGDAVAQHFADIGHDMNDHSVVFENGQARERTQILMDIANQVGGIVIGTGDLSELALGWCTYNADHMSMYGVNAGVPKTLVRYLVSWCAEEEFEGETARILHDICDTPVSPELLPPNEAGDIQQKTEEHIGPYIVHDYFLYHMVRLHYPPKKTYALACHAFAEDFPADKLLEWLEVFYRRFFSQQFKRSCLPDGPKIGSVALSPRGDWRMPSDAVATLWLNEIESLKSEQAND